MTTRYGQSPAGFGGVLGGPLDGAQGRPDLLRVALVAYAVHLTRRGRVRPPGRLSAWGLAGRLAALGYRG